MKARTQTWLLVIVLSIAVPVVTIIAVLTYVNATSTKLHPDPKAVISTTASAPLPKWVDAVEHARQIIRAALSEQNLPGMSVAVGVGAEIVWAEGFGWANIETRVPMAPNTRLRIGHVSKALTSAAAGLLLEKGTLRFDDEIQTYVPAFPKKQWPVTVRQLMAHTAGIKHYSGEEADVPTGHCDKASEGLRSFADDPLLFEPGTEFRYSTYGWVLVSAAIEAAAGEPFFAFMRTHVFTPLGMADTLPDSPTEPMPNRATFYFPRFSGENTSGPEPAHPVDYSCFAGAGAFLSTPSDLVRFGQAMNDGTLLLSGTVSRLQSPQILTSGKDTGYGLGWTLDTVPLSGESTRLSSDASRSLLGGSTSFLVFPERHIVVALMTNTSYATTRSIALDVAGAFSARGR